MYEAYYGLQEQAFRKAPDPRNLYLNATYEDALGQLVFAVEEMELAPLAGEVGSGKTLLSRVLIDRIGDRHEVGMILNPRLSPRQFHDEGMARDASLIGEDVVRAVMESRHSSQEAR